MSKCITQFVVKRVGGKRQKVGTLVGVLVGKDLRIGVSLANVNAGDRFDKDKGLKIATGRALKWNAVDVPPSIKDEVMEFKQRCKRYFKGYGHRTPYLNVLPWGKV